MSTLSTTAATARVTYVERGAPCSNNRVEDSTCLLRWPSKLAWPEREGWYLRIATFEGRVEVAQGLRGPRRSLQVCVHGTP